MMSLDDSEPVPTTALEPAPGPVGEASSSRSLPAVSAVHSFLHWLPLALLCLVATWGFSTTARAQDQDRPKPDLPAAPARPGDRLHDEFSLPIEIESLPAGAEFVPVTCHLDFTAALRRRGVAGVLDDRSLRLYRQSRDGDEEVPLQFVPSPQPRPPGRTFLADTPSTVSYLGEYPAGAAPAELKMDGSLTWAARGDPDGVARYRLTFGVLRRGSLVQVPYPPHDLKAFDPQGRASSIRWFPRMQIRPQW